MACAHCSGHGEVRHVSPARTNLPRYAPRPASDAAPMCEPDPCGCACGSLECLCRPRWVAGMVIQESDLNRLDHYITAKQRLHNRFVHGVGVVCGLVVTCHPCGGGVVRVSPGYALGPCGEDIVVCDEDSVDVCALIRKCRSLERRDVDCRPWGDDRACRDVRETWVLAVRYDERPSRNAPMLRAGKRDCGTGCEGGCDGSCGCDGCCGTKPPKQVRRESPTACLPTVVCETYRYEVFRAPPQPDCRPRGNRRSQPGRLVQRLQACLEDLLAIVRRPPQAPLNAALDRAGRHAWNAFCVRLKAGLREHLIHEGTTACTLVEELCAVPCASPDLEGQAFVNAMSAALAHIAPILTAAVKDCLCLAALPPCPEPVHDPRLPLALVTVEGGAACSVVEICNTTPLRPVVGTFPNVAYWLSAFGVIERIRTALFCFCCGTLPAEDRHAGVPPGAVPFDFDFAQFGMVGDWLKTMQPDPAQALQALGVMIDPGGTAALKAQLDALKAEIEELKRNL